MAAGFLLAKASYKAMTGREQKQGEDVLCYEKCAEHLQDVMRNEQREHETAQQKALEKYSELDTPFYLHAGISKDAFDYIEFYILFLAILCVAIAAPTFAGEYQTGGDSILRTTKHGRTRLAVTKILAAFTLFIVTFLVGITVHILILNVAFGTDCLKTSFQMLYSIPIANIRWLKSSSK